jgi:hypothetical protein
VTIDSNTGNMISRLPRTSVSRYMFIKTNSGWIKLSYGENKHHVSLHGYEDIETNKSKEVYIRTRYGYTSEEPIVQRHL